MAADNPKKHRVFISHSTKDKWIAVQLDKMIQARGVETFRDDRDIGAGVEIIKEIHAQLMQSQELLVLWSPQAIASKWIDSEVSMAFGMQLHVVAIRYLTEPESLPVCIKHTHAPELTEADVNKYLDEVEARAKKFKGA